MARRPGKVRKDHGTADVSLWNEAVLGSEILFLHAAPVFYGMAVPRGDQSAVVLIPGFLGTDLYLMELYAWLWRIGYRPYFSGIGLNADCPNLLIRYRLNETIDKAREETGRRVHLIGHSLGGIIARAAAAQRQRDVASVITLGAPFRGTVLHSSVLRVAEAVRKHILQQRGEHVLPECYTGRCTCNFLDSLRRRLPGSIKQTAVYTRDDGIVDWRYCLTGHADRDFEVSGSHIGLVFNSEVYTVIAERLLQAQSQR